MEQVTLQRRDGLWGYSWRILELGKWYKIEKGIHIGEQEEYKRDTTESSQVSLLVSVYLFHILPLTALLPSPFCPDHDPTSFPPLDAILTTVENDLITLTMRKCYKIKSPALSRALTQCPPWDWSMDTGKEKNSLILDYESWGSWESSDDASSPGKSLPNDKANTEG